MRPIFRNVHIEEHVPLALYTLLCFPESQAGSQWWLTPVILAPMRPRQEDQCAPKKNLGYILKCFFFFL